MRVAEMAVRIGKILLNEQAIERLESAALLHDIGKIGLPDSILHKPGKLTSAEWDIMNQQDRIGMQIISSAFESDGISRIIEAHRGTMHGRTASVAESLLQPKNSTVICGDIITVCDAFDSMMQEQPWRRGMSLQEALNELIANCPRQFNSDVVKALVESIREEGLPFNNARNEGKQEEAMDAVSKAIMLDEQIDQLEGMQVS